MPDESFRKSGVRHEAAVEEEMDAEVRRIAGQRVKSDIVEDLRAPRIAGGACNARTGQDPAERFVSIVFQEPVQEAVRVPAAVPPRQVHDPLLIRRRGIESAADFGGGRRPSAGPPARSSFTPATS